MEPAQIAALLVVATVIGVIFLLQKLLDRIEPKPESHADRWKRIEAEVTARMQEHARQFEERLVALEAAKDQPQTLTEYLATHRCKGFKPSAHYNSDGDMIECWLADDMSYGEQITPGITVMRSQETDEIVGVQIHGVWRMVVEMESKP